jgi:GNAT superfamily N-acetyltransferase
MVFERAWNAGHPYAPRKIDTDQFLSAIQGRLVLVACAEKDVIVGFVGINVPDKYIHHLYVDPAWSGFGIGRVLLAQALSALGGRASLKCQTRNTNALRFYKREGWTAGEVGETDGEQWVRLLHKS